MSNDTFSYLVCLENSIPLPSQCHERFCAFLLIPIFAILQQQPLLSFHYLRVAVSMPYHFAENTLKDLSLCIYNNPCQGLKCTENSALYNLCFRFARLQSVKGVVAGRLLFIRFVATTGDAMGMNMVSKVICKLTVTGN